MFEIPPSDWPEIFSATYVATKLRDITQIKNASCNSTLDFCHRYHDKSNANEIVLNKILSRKVKVLKSYTELIEE